MDSAKINDWLQVIGLFGVIASLIFVGLQMKQDRDIALSAAYQARTEISLGMDYDLRNNPVMISAFIKLTSGQAMSLTRAEEIVIVSYIGSMLDMYENLHYQYVSGFIGEEHWNKSLFQLRNMVSPDTCSRDRVREAFKSGIPGLVFGIRTTAD